VERNFVAGREELQRARALDPTYTWPLMFESYIAIARGDYDSALQLAEQVMEIDPRFFYDVDPIANVYVAQGRWQDAVKRYASLPAELLARPNFQLAICYAQTGQSDLARDSWLIWKPFLTSATLIKPTSLRSMPRSARRTKPSLRSTGPATTAPLG